VRGVLASLVMRRLGGNRIRVNAERPDLPVRAAPGRSAAVIGGGIAGITAAALLGERGLRVTLFERNPHLGGKAGSWTVTLADGFTTRVDHGFHGFFRQYHNLRTMMERFGSASSLVPIDDYLILSRELGSFSFKGIARTPLLNMLSLRKTGLYRIGDMLRNPESRRLLSFLTYDAERTFSRHDAVSYRAFADAARIPPALRVMFNTFTRSFFADPELMSSAELMKSFHFYFLSNDLGLLYDYLNGDYESAFIAPARRYLAERGVEVRTSAPVDAIERSAGRLTVSGSPYDHVILAADVGESRRIVEDSSFIARESPETARRFSRLARSQGYAVLRVWLDRPVERKSPPFIATEKIRFLDSVTLNDRVDPVSAAWAAENRGSVLELHSYALPRGHGGRSDVRDGLLRELETHLPELQGARVIHEHLELREDFTAFHTGMHALRPEVDTGIPGLFAAGDWVRLPVPAMLMEAACTSAFLAANEVCGREGIRPEPVYSVPLKGMFA
jgi:carotenoid phi-ring synthase / carotenoid chi-ring synthase